MHSKTTRRVIEIVSTSTPCGVTYLLNVLVELNYLIFTGKFNLFWKIDKENRATPNPLLKQKFGIWMPGLIREREFYLSEPVFYWSHEWPRPQPKGVRRILFVRDPRDALYSHYKRVASGDSLVHFLKQLQIPLGFSRIDKWALQNLLWIDLSRKEDFLIVRFEDLKTEPLKVLNLILNFCGGLKSEEECETAIALSSTEKVKEAHDNLHKIYDRAEGKAQIIIRKGQSFEWRSSPNREDISLYSTFGIQKAINLLGYEVTEQNESSYQVKKRERLDAEFCQLYGVRNNNLSEEHIKKVKEVLSFFPDTAKSMAFTKQRLLPFIKLAEMRIIVFQIGISLISSLWKLMNKLFPPGARYIEKIIMNYSLGDS